MRGTPVLAKKQAAAPGEVLERLRVMDPVKVSIAAVNKAPYNPRVMPREKMEALKASLLKHGMVLNLVVQRQSPKYGPMVIIGGHQRIDAIRAVCDERGWAVPEHAWAVVLDVGDDEAKELNIALNAIEGEFDAYKLGLVFDEIYPRMTPTDVLATGFRPEQIAELRELTLPPDVLAQRLEQEAGQLGSFAKSVTLTVEFDSVEQRDKAKERLAAMAKERGEKPWAVLLKALGAMQVVPKKLAKAK